jgi:transcriptional regulator with XRE-family HTH domain
MRMKLDQYLASRKITDADFGRMIDRGQSTVNRLRRGETSPDWETVQRIVDATGGVVTANDFLKKNPSKKGAAA